MIKCIPIFLEIFVISAKLMGRQPFETFITSNPELYFRAISANARDTIGLYHLDKNIQYKPLFNGSIKVIQSCAEELIKKNISSISIYKFNVNKQSRVFYLENKLIMTFPATELPLKSDKDMSKIFMLYPVFSEAIDVFRYNSNGFWLQVRNASGWINRFSLKIDVPNGQEENFKKAFENVVKIQDKKYVKNCPNATKF